MERERRIPAVEHSRDYRSELQRREQECWSTLLRAPVELPPMPRDLTPAVAEKFNGDPEYMGIRAFPKLDIGTLDDLERLGIDDFLARIEQKYPGLHVYEKLTETEKHDHTIGRLPEKWYWRQVEKEDTAFPRKYGTGGWLVIEVMPKPAYGSSYEQTMISDRLDHPERFNISWNTAHRDISSHKSAILSKLGLPTHCDVRMQSIEESNMLANREGLGATNTNEWVENKYYGEGRLMVGNSDHGGASHVRWDFPALSTDHIGFRVVAVLDS